MFTEKDSLSLDRSLLYGHAVKVAAFAYCKGSTA